ncbi:MAG: hypothetical protein ABIJ39_03070 [Chloroflexota bacterium]
MTTKGRTRCAIALYKTPSLADKTDKVIPRSDRPVEITEEQGNWFKISYQKPGGGTLTGFVPRTAVALPPPERPALFPSIVLPSGEAVPGVPGTTRMTDFNNWLNSGGQPGWIPGSLWSQLTSEKREAMAQDVRAVIARIRGQFDAWQLEVHSHRRRSQALMEELEVYVAGGQDMLAADSAMVYLLPARDDQQIERVESGDILLWTGVLHLEQSLLQKQLWHKVKIFKFDSDVDGWILSDSLAAYNYPTPQNDPAVPANAANVFDLSQPILRLPADQAVIQARASALAANWGAAQYIDVVPVIGATSSALGGGRIHYRLCGEFCCAVIAGKDIYPLLQQWKTSNSDTAMRILKQNTGTFAQNLISLLRLFAINSNLFDARANRGSLKPHRLQAELAAGRVAITGVRIGGRGPVDPEKHIDHWVVLLDVLPVGASGWVRIYNPFLNQEEVYLYDTFMDSFWKFPYWTWVENPVRVEANPPQ